MRVLLDECLPRPLKRLLVGYDVETIQERGWGGIKNGELLSLAEEHFDVFLTADQNLRYQQNLSDRKIAIVELPVNRRAAVLPLITQIIEAIEKAVPGSYIVVKLPVAEQE